MDFLGGLTSDQKQTKSKFTSTAFTTVSTASNSVVTASDSTLEVDPEPAPPQSDPESTKP